MNSRTNGWKFDEEQVVFISQGISLQNTCQFQRDKEYLYSGEIWQVPPRSSNQSEPSHSWAWMLSPCATSYEVLRETRLLLCHSCQHALPQSNQENRKHISFRLWDILQLACALPDCYYHERRQTQTKESCLRVKGDTETCFSIRNVRPGLDLELKLFVYKDILETAGKILISVAHASMLISSFW